MLRAREYSTYEADERKDGSTEVQDAWCRSRCRKDIDSGKANEDKLEYLSLEVDARANKEPAGDCPYRRQRHCPQSRAKQPGSKFVHRACDTTR